MPAIPPLAVSARTLAAVLPCSRSHAHRLVREHGVLVAGVWRLPLGRLPAVVGAEMSDAIVKQLNNPTNTNAGPGRPASVQLGGVDGSDTAS